MDVQLIPLLLNWGFGVLGFWGFGVLGFWGFGVLGCVASIGNKEMVTILHEDILRLTNHSKAFVRRKACIALKKIYCLHTDTAQIVFEKLKLKLDDPNLGIYNYIYNPIK